MNTSTLLTNNVGQATQHQLLQESDFEQIRSLLKPPFELPARLIKPNKKYQDIGRKMTLSKK